MKSENPGFVGAGFLCQPGIARGGPHAFSQPVHATDAQDPEWVGKPAHQGFGQGAEGVTPLNEGKSSSEFVAAFSEIAFADAGQKLDAAFQPADPGYGKSDLLEVEWDDRVEHFTGHVGEQADPGQDPDDAGERGHIPR